MQHALANDTLRLGAQLVVAAVGIECALGQVEAPDPIVLDSRFAATVFEAQRLVVVQRVFETNGAIGGL